MFEKITLKPPFPEDMKLQSRVWRAERIGWIVMALLVLAGLFGTFSHGLLSNTMAASGDGNLSVDYERFSHKTARTQFVISLPRASQETRQETRQDTRILLSPAFQRSYDIEVLYPLPTNSSAGAAGLELAFARSVAGDLTVHIAARPKRFGIASLSVEADGQSRASFTQFIYP
jgi:hypothetical protein